MSIGAGEKMDRPKPLSPVREQPTETSASPLNNDSLIAWITRAERRPAKYASSESTGYFRLTHFEATTPPETNQFRKYKLRPGDSLRCWLKVEGQPSNPRVKCFARDEVADQLEEWPEGVLLCGTIVCLGQMKVITNDWVSEIDEDRGVEFYAAWLIKSVERV
jgi:hypothetical protein